MSGEGDTPMDRYADAWFAAGEAAQAEEAAAATQDEDGDEPDAWRSLLASSVNRKSGEVTVKTVASNALVYVRHHPALAGRLGQDARSRALWWLYAPPWDDGDEQRQVRDADATELQRWVADPDGEGVCIGREAWMHALEAEAVRRPFDRFADWLTGLAWDGEDRLTSWLADYCGAQAGQYTDAVARAWLVSAVARTLEPACQADHVLVLEGPQGAGKTSTLRTLAGLEWHAEIGLDSTKDAILALHGPVVCEWSELAGLGKKDLEAIKSVVTRRVDRVRPHYGRMTLDLPRRCVLAATTNDAEWATDEENRRFWPVRVTTCDLDGLAAVREQLWAEALAAYRAGECWWLQHEDEDLARDVVATRVAADPWIAHLLAAVGPGGRLAGRDWATREDLLDALDVPHERQASATARRIARVCRALDWSVSFRRRDGKMVRGYALTRQTQSDENKCVILTMPNATGKTADTETHHLTIEV